MRPALAALLVLVAGCGTVVPYSLAPDVLAPELVPEQAASVLVVTDRADVGVRASVAGRVLDRETSAPLAARVLIGEAELQATDGGVFATPTASGPTRVRVVLEGYAPAEAVVDLHDGERTQVLVLLGAGA